MHDGCMLIRSHGRRHSMRTRVRLFLAGSLLAALLAIGIGSSPRAFGAPTPEEKVVGGPYVVSVGRRSATVIWLVETGQASVGLEPGKLDRTTPLLRTERIEFTGLAPGTTYYYQSFPGDAGKGSFKTAPAGAAKFQFVVYGDTRT